MPKGKRRWKVEKLEQLRERKRKRENKKPIKKERLKEREREREREREIGMSRNRKSVDKEGRKCHVNSIAN